jgi:SAM-dependent methyltransferase
MSQRITSIYRLVTFPAFYRGLSAALGSDRARRRLATEIFRAEPGTKVLDVGCGPASIFPYLPQVNYTGMDLNPKHIEYAKALYGTQGRFLVGDASRDLQGENESFDLVVVSALLHHLDDSQARELLERLCRLTKAGGRIVTFDNVWLKGQNPIAWSLNKLDSGLNVRSENGYRSLAKDLPVTVDGTTYRDLLRIPYDHFSMVMTKR